MSSQKDVYNSDRIIRSLEDGFLRADNDGSIIMANETLATLCGYSSPEKMIGMHEKELHADPKDRDQMISQLKYKSKLLNYELELVRKDGTTFWALNNIKTFSDEKGKVLGTETIIRDITERKQI